MSFEGTHGVMQTRPSFDVVETLPVGGADRLRALRQDVADKRNLTVPFADRHEANSARGDAERQLQRLIAHRSDGGFGLEDTDARVIAAQKLVEKLTGEAKRIADLDAARTPAWRIASATLVRIETFLRNGVPGGCVLQDYDGKVPTLAKGEALIDAIENRRRRVRELRADLHRIQSAPFPSSYAKAQMRAQIDALAMQGAPNVSDLIEHDREIVFPTTNLRSHVFNTEVPALAMAEAHDPLALIAWMFKPALVAALDKEINSEADDAAALTHQARQQQEAVVQRDLLAVERDEAALVWAAIDQRLPVDHRADINPVALLGVMIVSAPRIEASGSSREHAIDIVDPSRPRRR